LVCFALPLFGIANPLWAQDEPKQDESQQEGEPKQDKDPGKQEETKSKKKNRNGKRGSQLPVCQRSSGTRPSMLIN
jgi:hypothetical protein